MQSPRRALLILLSLAVTATWTTTAHAQGRMSTGEMIVTVRDVDGAGMPGATITLSGDGLVQESVTVASGPDGTYRFRSLGPGTYRLVVTMDGFEESLFEEVLVRVGQTTSVPVPLAIAGVEESVTVVAAGPIIETTSSQIATAFDEQVIQNVPLPRDFIAVGDLSAGVTDRGAFGAGGNIEGRYRVGSGTNAYRLNGVDVTEPFFGNTWIDPSVDTLAEVQVVGIGASAEYGNFMGATVNLVTKSGTNEFHGTASFYHSSDGLQGENARIDDLRHDSVRYDQDMAFSIGGPVVERKLLFFANGGWQREAAAPYDSDNYFDHDRFRIHGRLDWLLNDTNTLGFMVNSDPARDRDLGLTVARPDPAIGYSIDFGSTTWLASWQSAPSNDTFIDVRYAGYQGTNETLPNTCCDVPSLRDGQTGNFYGSSGYIDLQNNRRHEVDASVTHYVRDFLGADHDIKVGLELEDTRSNQEVDLSGGVGMSAYSYGYYTYLYGYTYTAHFDSKVQRVGAFVQDDVTVTDRLNLNLGLRFDRPRILDDYEGSEITLAAFENLAPRLGFTYDLSGRGEFLARGSYGRYYEKALVFGPLASAGDVYEPTRVYFQFLFGPFDYDSIDTVQLQEGLVQPENLLFVGPTSLTPIDPDLRSPYADVFSVGLEKVIGKNYVLALDYIYKRDRDFIVYEDRNADQHTYAPIEYTDFLGGTQTLYQRTDSVPSDLWMTNADFYRRQHHFVTARLERRASSGFIFMSSLTYQRSTGNIENDINTAWGLGSTSEHTSPNFNGHPYTEGLLTYDRTWQLKALASHLLPGDVRLSAYYTYQSGRPWTPQARTASLELNDIPFTNVMRIEPRGSRRWEGTNLLDLRAQKSFRLGGGASRLDLMFDVFNVFNDSAPLRVGERENNIYPLSGESSFGQPLALTPPREARLGLRFVF